MKFDTPIPSELAHLKRDKRGYPIPFFVTYKNGEPQFQIVSVEKVITCVDKKICPICGKKLYKDGSYVVSGPMGLHNRITSDAPMHRVCAEFSIKACPHLYYEKAKRRAINEETAATLLPNDHMAQEKPDELFLAKVSNKFSLMPTPSNAVVIKYTLISWQRYRYKEGFLEIDQSEGSRGGATFHLTPEKEAERQSKGAEALLNALNRGRKL